MVPPASGEEAGHCRAQRLGLVEHAVVLAFEGQVTRAGPVPARDRTEICHRRFLGRTSKWQNRLRLTG